MSEPSPLRIGVLGAARIAPAALVRPARKLPEVEVVAVAALSSPQVDRAMKVDFRFADGRTGHIHCSLFSSVLFRVRATVRGEDGALSVFNPMAPHLFHRLTLRTAAGKTTERVSGDATFTCQLRAFAACVPVARG
jgi:predicted dehydrogenase